MAADDTLPDPPKDEKTPAGYDLGEWYQGFRSGQASERHDWLEAQRHCLAKRGWTHEQLEGLELEMREWLKG